MLKKITLALDLAGCPNRCRHCWLGWGPNGGLSREDLAWAAEAFRPYARELAVYDWYREPDYSEDYRERWELCESLSTPGSGREHFELASLWRLARDESYAAWLKGLGVNAVQVTLFGGEEATGWFTGRRGAYEDILKAMEALLAQGIAPRIQVFVNKRNLDGLGAVEALIEELRLEERCREAGREFSCFVHQGSCDGKNADFYSDWVTPGDLEKIPPRLAAGTLRHWGAKRLREVFGQTEAELAAQLREDRSTYCLSQGEPVLYVDPSWDVYPNFTTPGPGWRLGNLKRDGAARVLEAYQKDESPGQRARKAVPVCQLAQAYADPESQRLFGKDDYIIYLLNRYLEGET